MFKLKFKITMNIIILTITDYTHTLLTHQFTIITTTTTIYHHQVPYAKVTVILVILHANFYYY